MAGDVWLMSAGQVMGLRPGSRRCLLTSRRLGRAGVSAFNSDSPHLPASVLEERLRNSTARDVVVGPTHDGGY